MINVHTFNFTSVTLKEIFLIGMIFYATHLLTWMKEKSYIIMTYNLKVLDSKNSASDLSNMKVIDPLIREITFSKIFGGFLEFLKNHFQKVESLDSSILILAYNAHDSHEICKVLQPLHKI